MQFAYDKVLKFIKFLGFGCAKQLFSYTEKTNFIAREKSDDAHKDNPRAEFA